MKNETIKTYTPITVEEAGEMLRANNWKPVEGLAHKEAAHSLMIDSDRLIGIDVESECPFKFKVGHHYARAFKVTEIDPCKAPDGCPELDPWMAYVGMDVERKHRSYLAAEPNGHGWGVGFSGDGTMGQCYAIDVRTEWAQEHFPEFCRIRDYQEPDPFLDFIMRKFEKSHLNPSATYYLTGESMKELYELGQANPTKGAS